MTEEEQTTKTNSSAGAASTSASGTGTKGNKGGKNNKNEKSVGVTKNKQPSKRAQRILKQREPKIFEDVKEALFIKGPKTSGVINQALKDLAALKKPHSIVMRRLNDIRPFESESSIDFFSDKNDASLFMYGSHNKKRPHNLIIGRTFDYHLLDMMEFGIENFKSMDDFSGDSPAEGSKPCIIFQGEGFEKIDALQKFSNLITDKSYYFI